MNPPYPIPNRELLSQGLIWWDKKKKEWIDLRKKPTCKMCNKKIKTEVVDFDGKKFHPSCKTKYKQKYSKIYYECYVCKKFIRTKYVEFKVPEHLRKWYQHTIQVFHPSCLNKFKEKYNLWSLDEKLQTELNLIDKMWKEHLHEKSSTLQKRTI